MKILFSVTLLLFLTVSKQDCGKKKTSAAGTVCKGRLEIKGICMNYTIKLLEGAIDTSLIESQWTDETTGKSYTNVFALGSPCTFPSTIRQGDEFEFRVDTGKIAHCAVCLAYYPKPRKHIAILCTGQ